MTAWAIEALLASGVLIALVLALRVPVRRAFGPTVAYGLWAIPALRLLLPPLPAGWVRETATPLAVASEQVVMLVLPDVPHQAGPPVLGMALVALWCAGALLFLGHQLFAYARFTRRVSRTGTVLGRVGRIALIVSEAVPDPLAFGLARPVVAVPPDFRARYGPEERELALAHEVGHHRRGDIAANWVALLILALHWFNPLAWIAFRAFRADQEMANDACVLARSDTAERHAYACAILKAAGARVPAAACALHSVNDLKGRLRMLARPISRSRRVLGSVAIAGATLAALGVTASGSEAARTVRAEVERAAGAPLDALVPAVPFPAALGQTPPTPPAPGARKARQVVIVRDGKTETYEGAAADAYIADHPLPLPPEPPAPPLPRVGAVPPIPPLPRVGPVPSVPPLPPLAGLDDAMRGVSQAMRDIPRIVSRTCRREPDGSASTGSMTTSRIDGGQRVIVICTDRIAAAARRAELASVDAGRIRRDAMARALDGLRRARATMASGRDVEPRSSAQHAEALAGIDRSIAELEREAASATERRSARPCVAPRGRSWRPDGRRPHRHARPARAAGHPCPRPERIALHLYGHPDAPRRHHRPGGDRSRPGRSRSPRRPVGGDRGTAGARDPDHPPPPRPQPGEPPAGGGDRRADRRRRPGPLDG